MRRLESRASVALKHNLQTFEQRRTFVPLSTADATPRSKEETLALERDPYNFQFNVLADSPSWVAHKREHNRDVITEARNRPAPSFEVSAAYKSVIRYQAAKARAGKEQLE